MQIPCGVHSQIQKEGNTRQSEKCTGRTVPRVRRPEREHNSGSACHEGTCPHADMHSAQVQCLASRGVHQGEKRNLDYVELPRKAATSWAAFLGARLLRKHGGTR